MSGFTPSKNELEDQLAALTREFVRKLVDVLRNASLADVAALSGNSLPGPSMLRPERDMRPARGRNHQDSSVNGSAVRQNAARRAEVGERLTQVLSEAAQPLGVRGLASRLGVDPSVLAAPLRELRAAGKIRKHGEKRATTYSLA